jgi:FtsP/CotA-like multicopper oxidase with cupredoxin domain
MHWHGIRQMNSGNMDGTNGVTECPIPPGGSRTYTFLLTQFGSSWYHSHHSAQYGDGVLGPIVIAGPATSNYDIDLGAMPITDWYYQTAFQKSVLAAIPGPPPVADNGLINGTMLNPSGSGGAYNKVTLTSGKKYRLRLINTSVDNHFRVSLDNHNLTVIQADFVPTQPYVAEWIFLGIGERYDVIIDANQAVDNCDNECITPTSMEGGTRVLAVNCHDETFSSIRCHSRVCDGQSVRNGISCHRPCGIIIGSNAEAVAPTLSCKRAIRA